MPKLLKRILIALAALVVVGFVAFRYMKMQTKKHSPEESYAFFADDFKLQVTYCRPFKKGREIFGGLVPYGKVWRTGANEATILESSHDFTFAGTPVKAGAYTLWTLPGPDQWEVYLNSGMYSWGVDFDGNAQRDASKDVAAAKVPVAHEPDVEEQFTIRVTEDGSALTMRWDDVLVSVPISH